MRHDIVGPICRVLLYCNDLVKMYYHSHLGIIHRHGHFHSLLRMWLPLNITYVFPDTGLIFLLLSTDIVLVEPNESSQRLKGQLRSQLVWSVCRFPVWGGRCTVLLDLCDIVMLIVHTSCYSFDSISEEMVGGGLTTARTRQWLKRDCILECFNHVNLHCVVHIF
jgi:hypothetical protein